MTEMIILRKYFSESVGLAKDEPSITKEKLVMFLNLLS